MCGIAGWLGYLPQGDQVARRIMQLLRHRGPDAQGLCQWSGATLIHTRLSIIDLSPAGNQPMSNEDGSVWVVFNGEIYNHHKLRYELESSGHIFKGRSDAEVLPHLYEEEGEGLVVRLRGMFALAIYDIQNKTLLLARDRFGIKPLFYAPRPQYFAFASEINALRQIPQIDLQPNKQAVYDFIALSYIPAPETFYTGIKATQPGELLKVHFIDHEIVWHNLSYHHWSITPDPSLTLKKATDCADELISVAVQRQLESDVPLGTLLSGGIDSSLVSFAAQKGTGGELKTFNVKFPDKCYDETPAALEVARNIRSSHLILDMGKSRGEWEYVSRLLCYTGQPFADTSIFAVDGICRLMRRYVTVALSGDGGDEGFGGYDLYRWLMWICYLQMLPASLWHRIAFSLSPLSRIGVVRNALLQLTRNLAYADETSIIQTLFCWLREEEQKSLCVLTDVLPVRRLFEPQWAYHLPSEASGLERLSAQATEVCIRLRLPNDFLFKVDAASMQHSLEIRVPMLDEDLVEFGLTLPHHLKVRGRSCKLVLREIAKRKLPAKIAKKPKWGFAVPVDMWVDADFKRRLRETLLGPSSRLPEFFRPEVYRPWIEAFCQGRRYLGISRAGLYQRVIMLLSVYLALENKNI